MASITAAAWSRCGAWLQTLAPVAYMLIPTMSPGVSGMMSPGWRHRAGTEFLAFEATAVKDGNG
jgi:hypothetical protein